MEHSPDLSRPRESREEENFRKMVDQAVYWRDTTNTRDQLATPLAAAGRALDNHGYKARDKARNAMLGRVMAALARRKTGDSPLLKKKPVRPALAVTPPVEAVAPPVVSDDERDAADKALRAMRRRDMFRDAAAHEKRQPRDAYAVDDDSEAA